jgi:hypothetical protein
MTGETPQPEPAPDHDWTNYDDFDDAGDEDDFDPGEECGRWLNGNLDRWCRLAGTEFCDFECPYRDRS